VTPRAVPVVSTVEDLDELPDRVLARLEPTASQSVPLCVVKLDGELYALADSCPHRGVPLSDGFLDGGTVGCRRHGLRFDVRTGKSATGLRDAATPYRLSTDNGKLTVRRAWPGWLRWLERRRRSTAPSAWSPASSRGKRDGRGS
jgi:nitrite reductase/ring-hydroxylating ferredoxin subunit